MRKVAFLISFLLSLSFVAGEPQSEEGSTEKLVGALLAQGITPERIIDLDRNGVPRVCGTGLTDTGSRAESVAMSPGDLPPGTRGWECVPGVIRNDGEESFRLEVNVNGPVNTVLLDSISTLLAPPSGAPILLLDDGQGEDVVVGDGVYTAGPFRFDNSVTMPAFYMADPASPAGLAVTTVGNVTITETDGSESTFLIQPEVGLLRDDIPSAPITFSAPELRTTPHLINILSTARESQRFLRLLGGDLRNLTARIYAALPDAFDFFVFLSAEKIERLPRTSSSNFIAGIHSQVQTNFTGTGLTVFDGTASYGSRGVLLSVNVLDAFARGIVGNNVTHELNHQWASSISTSLGLSDGAGHYKPRTSAGSLVGGFQWIDHGDGSFTLNCGEGRNGATRAPPIDLYMMGLVQGDAVPALHVNETINFATDCGGLVESLVDITVEDIQAVHGIRWPGPKRAKRSFNIAFIVESHHRLLNSTELTYFEVLAEHYTSVIPEGEVAPFVGNNWASIDRFFGEGVTWNTSIPTEPQTARVRKRTARSEPKRPGLPGS